jgi:hypothetical protein
MEISWQYPEPRARLAGAWDKFVGPGATAAEHWLGMAAAFAGGAAMLLYALLGRLGWTPVQIVLAALLAFDAAGGVAINATSTAKRWYHREGQGFAHHFGSAIGHSAQFFLVAWLYRSMDWVFFGVTAGYLAVSSAAVLLTPLYIQRPVALVLYCGALLISLYAFAPTPGLEWLVPVYFLKLLVAHLTREEPYRPDNES